MYFYFLFENEKRIVKVGIWGGFLLVERGGASAIV